ncbi:MAG: hypothetical protein AAFN92_19635, partial [Bacteroidota bacterium]
MPTPKFALSPLFIGLLLVVSPLSAQETGSADWVHRLEFTAEGLTFPAAANGVEINGGRTESH